MKRRWKKKTHPRTSVGPTRGKYRQMWKRRMWDMVPGEEDMMPEGEHGIPTLGAGESQGSAAA